MSAATAPRRMNGGHAVARAIRQEGVGHVFCVPGESYTAIMDGLHDMPIADGTLLCGSCDRVGHP